MKLLCYTIFGQFEAEKFRSLLLLALKNIKKETSDAPLLRISMKAETANAR